MVDIVISVCCFDCTCHMAEFQILFDDFLYSQQPIEFVVKIGVRLEGI